MSHRVRWLGAMAIGALAVAIALGAQLFAAGRTPVGLGPAADPTTVPATRVEHADPRELTATFERRALPALAVGRDGVLTDSTCRPGTPIASGTVVLRLDEEPVMALHTSVPLYRELTTGSRGRDVAALQTELVRLGSTVTADGRYGPGTASAVRELEKSSGFSSPDGILSPQEILWLPAPSIVPATCEQQVGQRVSAQSTYATPAADLVSVRFSPLPSDAVPGPREVALFGARVALPTDGPVTEPAFLKAVAATPQFAQSAAKDAEAPKGSASLATPVAAYKVPPGALFALSGDKACVQRGSTSVPVTIVGSGLGASLVTSTIPLDRVAIGAGVTLTSCRRAE